MEARNGERLHRTLTLITCLVCRAANHCSYRITNGIWSDYATMAVRTGGPGAAGLSMLLVPLKGAPGVTMRRLKVAGQISAGTTFIELDDVKVPLENLIGTEGHGMRYVMASTRPIFRRKFNTY